ncbi:MAG: hypothetical protein ACREQ7_22570 [Candidatus Binatia bacterium]
MPEPVSPLTLEFLVWVSSRRRTYAEAMEAWQTTCPRHTVWEDAFIEGLIQVESEGPLHQPEVVLTPRGKAILDESSHKPIQA